MVVVITALRLSARLDGSDGCLSLAGATMPGHVAAVAVPQSLSPAVHDLLVGASKLHEQRALFLSIIFLTSMETKGCCNSQNDHHCSFLLYHIPQHWDITASIPPRHITTHPAHSLGTKDRPGTIPNTTTENFNHRTTSSIPEQETRNILDRVCVTPRLPTTMAQYNRAAMAAPRCLPTVLLRVPLDSQANSDPSKNSGLGNEVETPSASLSARQPARRTISGRPTEELVDCPLCGDEIGTPDAHGPIEHKHVTKCRHVLATCASTRP
jgi:hypothetical protein